MNNDRPDRALLLSSMAEFWPLLEPVITAAGARRLCEIGTGAGQLSTVLADYCRSRAGVYTGIDPEAGPDLAVDDAVVLERRPSLEVLPQLPPQDAYFIDGDHNYYTVSNELRLILRHTAAGHWPLVFLHDVGWPWGRRDQYCEPERIPPEHRHPHSSTGGVIPGRNEPGAGGFSGATSDYHYHAADHEGGSRNGVLTAVEDLLAEQPADTWRWVVLPSLFGLGMLWAPDHLPPPAAQLLDHLAQASAVLGPFLETLERNRIELFLAHLDDVTINRELTTKWRQLKEAYDALNQHRRELRDSYKELQAVYHGLKKRQAPASGTQAPGNRS